jgi:hypothetical protein
MSETAHNKNHTLQAQLLTIGARDVVCRGACNRGECVRGGGAVGGFQTNALNIFYWIFCGIERQRFAPSQQAALLQARQQGPQPCSLRLLPGSLRVGSHRSLYAPPD